MAANTETETPQTSDNVYWIKSENEQNDCENSDFKTKFNKQLMDFYESQNLAVKKPWTINRILEVIQHIKTSKVAIAAGSRRTSMQYYWCSKYEVSTSEESEYLIMKKKNTSDPTVRVIPIEQYFDLLFQIHSELDHGGRDKIVNVLKNKYYVQKKAVEIFVALCPKCETKRSVQRKNVKQIVSKSFNSNGQISLIDFQSTPDGDYKWLLKYQDNSTKFIQLRPLCTNQPSEIATELVKLFLTMGPPTVLLSDNEEILEEIMKIWPSCNIYHGNLSPPSQDLDNLELNNTDIENMLHSWIQDNSSTKWSLGCYFVQYQINTVKHSTEEKSPYHAIFGCDPKSFEIIRSIPEDFVEVKTESEDDSKTLKRIAEERTQEIAAKKIALLKVGDGVSVSVPKSDRGPLDTKFIVGKITDFNNGVYQVGTNSGIIKKWFIRNELQMFDGEFEGDVPNNLITLQEAVTKQTLFGDKDFNKCHCRPSKKQCQNFKCACFKKKVLCGPKCHSNLVCMNK